MITALIRTMAHRRGLFKRSWQSAADQGCNIIVHYGDKVNDYSYNLYCNSLKEEVTEGYFFFLDDDDFIIDGAVARILPHLEENKALICQMLRNNRPKPNFPEIVRGRIGLPCMVLHHKHKLLADVVDEEYGDYQWIKRVTEQIRWKFVPIPLVNAGKRSNGK